MNATQNHIFDWNIFERYASGDNQDESSFYNFFLAISTSLKAINKYTHVQQHFIFQPVVI